MTLKIARLHRLTAVATVTAALGLSIALPASAEAASFCQCVTYVQNYIGHINTLYAKNAGPPLKAMGYRESGSPMGINDIVVLQPGFAGANATAGHIAFLASYTKSGNTFSVILRGANQPGGWWTDHNCSNASRWSFSYANNSGIRYYRR